MNWKQLLINASSVLLGFILGSMANMGIIMLGGTIIPPPEGADVTTMEGLKASIHLFQPIHFLMPFLAHAIGTLIGSMIAFRIAISFKNRFAYTIGGLFLLGGIANIIMLPGPIWFTIVDLGLAYIPMSFLAIQFLKKN
ncbi:MAG: hypothetical protein O9264_03715 [Leptospira sp.]|nr:hypothetical protein [Leptospira sp.]